MANKNKIMRPKSKPAGEVWLPLNPLLNLVTKRDCLSYGFGGVSTQHREISKHEPCQRWKGWYFSENLTVPAAPEAVMPARPDAKGSARVGTYPAIWRFAQQWQM
jgi:hypothetical protein